MILKNRIATLIILLVGLAFLPSCQANLETGSNTQDPANEIKAEESSLENQGANKTIQVGQAEVLDISKFENREISSTREASDLKVRAELEDGILLDDYLVEIYSNNERGSEYNDRAGIWFKQVGQEPILIYELEQDPALINELVACKDFVAWVTSNGKTSSINLYDIAKGRIRELYKTNTGFDTFLLSGQKDNLIFRDGSIIKLYSYGSGKTIDLSDQSEPINKYDRPEINNGVLVYPEEENITLLNLETNEKSYFTPNKKVDFNGLKGNEKFLLWRDGLEDYDKLLVYDLNEDKLFSLSSDQTIFSYHLSGSKILLNIQDKIQVLDLEEETQGQVLANSDDSFISYGRVLEDGSVQFQESFDDRTEYLTISFE